jgi:hypothetical protein
MMRAGLTRNATILAILISGMLEPNVLHKGEPRSSRKTLRLMGDLESIGRRVSQVGVAMQRTLEISRRQELQQLILPQRSNPTVW